MSLSVKTLSVWLLLVVLSRTAQAADPPGTGIGYQMTDMFDTLLTTPRPPPTWASAAAC